MIGMGILQPVVVLAAQTMVMWLWMYATRIPAMRKARVDLDTLANDPEVTLDRVLPPSVQWKAHNYDHLHEAPTVFYAIAIVLAILGEGDGLNAQIAQAYVAVRVVYSLVHAIWNKVMLHFALFVLSSLALIAPLSVVRTFGATRGVIQRSAGLVWWLMLGGKLAVLQAPI